jgi:hypothetical protein
MGGKAFDNTRRVNRTEVFNVINDIGRRLMPDEKMLSIVLGSAGLSETSGDIDLNIDLRRHDYAGLLSKLTHLLGTENVKARPGNNQIFTSYPIPNTVDDQRVQVDFMFSEHPEWQTFSYSSPGDRSAFKGLFRTELIKAAVAFNSDWVLIEDGEMVARVGPTFFHDRGILWRYRFRPYKRNSTQRVKALVEATEEAFMEMFPDARAATNTVILTEYGVYELIFGPVPQTISMDRFDVFFSYENLHEALKEFYDAGSYHSIMQLYLERLNSLKVEIPDAIMDEIQHGAGI